MKVIGSALRKSSKKKTKRLETHLVFACDYYYYHEDTMRSFILDGMKKYKIKSMMVTIINMWRSKLITKEAMENYCKGKESEKNSVNDDLESLFEDLRLGKQPLERVWTYFLPKLTEEELEAVERKDPTYLETFGIYRFADVPEAEMMLSESDSKFVYAFGWRKTFTINNENIKNPDNLV